jgi:hypothetical protein
VKALLGFFMETDVDVDEGSGEYGDDEQEEYGDVDESFNSHGGGFLAGGRISYRENAEGKGHRLIIRKTVQYVRQENWTHSRVPENCQENQTG